MDSVISSFPSFQLGDKSSLGLLSFGGLFGKREIYTAGYARIKEYDTTPSCTFAIKALAIV